MFFSPPLRLFQKSPQLFPLFLTLLIVQPIPYGFSAANAPASEARQLTRDILDESLSLGRSFILRNQKREGNFFYEYDFVTKETLKGESPVRQAGTLWSLALIHADRPSQETLEAVKRGLAFFETHTRKAKDGRRYIRYPGESPGRTGTVALTALALIEFLRSEPTLENREKYQDLLKGYLQFLLSLRMRNGQFHSLYDLEEGKPEGPPSPYFDGETLFALTKAAKYLGFEDFREIILESAEATYQENVAKPLPFDPLNKTTKGFYQWGSMAYYELYTAGWPGTEKYAKRAIDLAYWMIDVRKVLERKKNTGYAYEGLVSAWELARLTGDRQAMGKIGDVIDRGLLKLCSWQVGNPLQNRFLKDHPTDDPRAVGGAMNGEADPVLRIDTTQHQMHAVILARRFIYRST